MRRLGVAVCVLTAVLLGGHARGQGTAFTYQGELREAGSPAQGTYAMTFELWDALSGGSRHGPAVSVAGVPVANGRFSVALDFGSNALGGGRWLEISVEGTALSPRQALTPTPFSIQTRGIFVDDAGDVGIGTELPMADLHIEEDRPTLRMTSTELSPIGAPRVELQGGLAPGVAKPLGAIDFLDSLGAPRASVAGLLRGSSPQLALTASLGQVAGLTLFETHAEVRDELQLIEGTTLETGAVLRGDGADSAMQLLGGRLGIGTEFPSALLDVAGDVDIDGLLVGYGGARFFNGDVGIGTFSPDHSLDVAGDARFRDLVGIGGDPSGFAQLTIYDDGAPFGVNVETGEAAFPTILATNTGSGPILWAQGTDDAAPGGGGLIVAGYEGGPNVAIDNNEIMARNNGQTTTLHLNADGGDVHMGLYDIKPPLAYGLINEDASIISASANVLSCQLIGNGRYQIEIAGGMQFGDIVVASPNRPWTFTNVTAGRGFDDPTKLEVYTYDVVNEEYDFIEFHFVVFRP